MEAGVRFFSVVELTLEVTILALNVGL
jgi:hypothetical protein